MSPLDRPTSPRPPRPGPTTCRAADWRKLAAVGLLALMLLLGVGAREGASAPVKAATPEEAFDSFRKAAASKDLKTMAALMTPELLDKTTGKVLGAVVFVVGFLEAVGGEDGKKKARAVYAVLNKHGITEADLKKLKGEKDALKALTARAKDKAALLGELVEVMEKGRKVDEKTRAREKEEREATLAARLKDLRIAGDTATATLVHKNLNRKTGKREEKEDPIRFKKIGANWRISEFPLD